MNHQTLRNAGLAGISALTLTLVACGGSSSTSTPPAAVNRKPTLSFNGDKTVVNKHKLVIGVTAQDDDGDATTITVNGVAVTGGVYTFNAATEGAQVITFKVSDGKDTVEVAYPVTVTANNTPVLPQAELAITTPATATLTLPALDGNNDNVSWALGTVPAALTGKVTLTNGVLSVNSTGVAAGSYDLPLVATENGGTLVSSLANNLTLKVTVTTAQVNFNVTNVTQPSLIVAGRKYPNDGLSRALGSTDLYNNRFTAFCDFPGVVQNNEELRWSLIYDGTIVSQVVTKGKANVEFFDEAGTANKAIQIPLTDLGARRYYSVQVEHPASKSVARSGDRWVDPIAPNFPYVTKVVLNDVRGLRSNGLMPVWNADKASSTLITGAPAQYIDVTLSVNDVMVGKQGDGMGPFTFENARAFVQGTNTALEGAIAIDPKTGVLRYTPAKNDWNKIPEFRVDVKNVAGMITTATINGLIADSSATMPAPAVYTGIGANPTFSAEALTTNAGQALVAVRDNHVPTLAAAAGVNAPEAIAAEEGSTPYKVVAATNLVIGDPDTVPALNGDYTDVLLLGAATLPNPFTGPCTKTFASGYLGMPVKTDVNNENVDLNEIVFSNNPGWTLSWNPSHPNVRKEVKFSVKATDLYDATLGTPLEWTSQVSAVITGTKLDSVINGDAAAFAALTPFAVPGADARVLHFWPVKNKGTVGAVVSPANPYGANTKYGLTGPSEFGVKAAETNGIFVTPTTNAAGTVAAFTTRGLNVDNDGTNANPSGNVVPHGYYLVKADDLRSGVRYADINGRFFFSKVTDGLDLSKTYIGRDTVDALPAVLGNNANLRIATLNGLTAWKPAQSALQFTNKNLQNGNVFLNIGDKPVVNALAPSAAKTAILATNVLDSQTVRLPFPGVQSLTQNIAAPGTAAGQTNSPLHLDETGTSNGALVADFRTLQANVANEAVLVTQLGAKSDLPQVDGKTIKAMAITKVITPSPAALPVLATGTIVDYLNTNTTASAPTAASWNVNLNRSEFFAALPGVGGVAPAPSKASFVGAKNEFFALYQAQGVAAGFETNAPVLFTFQNLVNAGDGASAAIAGTVNLNLGVVNFGNPFTSGTTVASYFAQGTVAVKNGNGTPVTATFADNGDDNGTIARIGFVTATQATNDAPYKTGILPVSGFGLKYSVAPVAPDTTVTVKSVDLANVGASVTAANVIAYGQNNAANGTAAFTLSWTAPAGTYSGADVEVWKYTGAATVPTKVTTFTTGGTSILVPKTLMPAGSSYFFRVRAYGMTGVDFNTTPLKRVFPMSYADFVSQAIEVL